MKNAPSLVPPVLLYSPYSTLTLQNDINDTTKSDVANYIFTQYTINAKRNQQYNSVKYEVKISTKTLPNLIVQSLK